ncbi:MAG: class F sortase [Candidatus Nomurabacteria bacterium]|jgi:hypothetical protein|nr:class F sortase [Candidatus Nomurabacteria bacterium]
MLWKGSRFRFLFTPFMVCFLLAVSALGIVSNAILAHATSQATAVEAQPIKFDQLSSALQLAVTERVHTIDVVAKDNTEKPKLEEPAQALAATQVAAAPSPQPAAPQGCGAARPFIYISAVGMCMHIITVGFEGGAVGTPPNTYQAGWFSSSAALGSGGASFVDGHSPGSFSAIKSVGSGIIITIGLANGQDVNYQVTAIENVPLEQVNMGRVLSSPGLNLMTCNGSPVGNTYSHRFIVYSTRI